VDHACLILHSHLRWELQRIAKVLLSLWGDLAPVDFLEGTVLAICSVSTNLRKSWVSLYGLVLNWGLLGLGLMPYIVFIQACFKVLAGSLEHHKVRLKVTRAWSVADSWRDKILESANYALRS
jgi:hypothetical protein